MLKRFPLTLAIFQSPEEGGRRLRRIRPVIKSFPRRPGEIARLIKRLRGKPLKLSIEKQSR